MYRWGWGVYGESLYLPLNFAVNLKRPTHTFKVFLSESRLEVSRGKGEEGNGESLLNAYRVSILVIKKILKIAVGIVVQHCKCSSATQFYT